MEQNTLSKTIDTADVGASYDKRVKRLLGEKVVLAQILKGVVAEFQDLSVDQIVKDCIEGAPQISTVAVDQDELDKAPESDVSRIEGMNSEDVSIKEGQIFYDVRFSAIAPGSKEPIRLIVNVEAQRGRKSPYPLIKRAIYYVSRMISAQKNTVFVKSHYEKIRKVYSIWILTNPPKKHANTITQYQISEKHIVGSVSAKASDYDLLTIVMLRLGAPDDPRSNAILRFLAVLLSSELSASEKKTILSRDFDVSMTTSMEKEVNEMCNLSEGIREEGRAEGRAEERVNTRIEDTLNLMKSLKLSAEDALKALRVPTKSRKTLLKAINERLAVE